MAETLTNWIIQYGYWATFFGAMLEGETAAFVSGIAAHHQLLSYPLTMLFAALGGIVSDTVLFFTGYIAGDRILPRFKQHRKKIRRVQQIIQQRQSLIIIGIRFAYGLRTAGPIIIGAAKVNPLKFIVMNIIGGTLWGMIIVSAGYYLSAFLRSLPIHRYLLWLLFAAVLMMIFWVIRRAKRHGRE